MAQIQTATSAQLPSGLNGQIVSGGPPREMSMPVSWEGDKMFNVYIHDYFIKRGFKKAAKELAMEADIGADTPPINARQGFLFEWWSVFWLFFQAKTTNQGPENVMLYYQWIQEKQHQDPRGYRHPEGDYRPQQGMPGIAQPRNPSNVMSRPPGNGVRPGGMVNGIVPGSIPPNQGQGRPGPSSQNQPFMPHPMQPNGGPGAAPQQAPHMNGIMDGAMNGSPRPPSQPQVRHPMTGQPPPSGGSSNPSQAQQPPQPGPPMHTMPQSMGANGRSARPPGQFSSPTMQNAQPSMPMHGMPGPGQQHPHMQGAPVHNPPMMGMMPGGPGRGGPHGGAPGQGPATHPSPRNTSNPSRTPTQTYQPLGGGGGFPSTGQGSSGGGGGPGSRSGTPGHTPTAMPHQSPGMAHREPPQQSGPPGPPQNPNEDMQRRMQPHPGMAMGPGQDLDPLRRIPPVFLAHMKQEAGLHDRDIQTLNNEEKMRLQQVFSKTMATYNGTAHPQGMAMSMGMGGMGMPMGRPGPRGGFPGGQPPPMAGLGMGPSQGGMAGHRSMPGMPQPPPAGAQRGQKRPSTSPGADAAMDAPKEQSPPDRKRPRNKSPQNPNTPIPGSSEGPNPPPMMPMSGFNPGQPGGLNQGFPNSAAGPQQNVMGNNNAPMGSMRGPMAGPPMGSLPGGGGMGMNSNMMGHPMPPGMNQMGISHPSIVGQMPPNGQHQPGGAPSVGRPPLQSPDHSYPFQGNNSMPMTHQYRSNMHQLHKNMNPNAAAGGQNVAQATATAPSPAGEGHDPGARGPQSAPAVGGGGGNMPPGPAARAIKGMRPPPSPASQAGANNGPKGGSMMPPPTQPAGGAPKEPATAPSPAAAPKDGVSGSPQMRPASGAAGSSGAPQTLSQGSAGGRTTPANSAPNTGAPSPSSILSGGRTEAAMGSLSRPSTSVPDAAPPVVAPPPPPASAPPAPGVRENFSAMDFLPAGMPGIGGLDDFAMESFEANFDASEFSQWINADVTTTNDFGMP